MEDLIRRRAQRIYSTLDEYFGELYRQELQTYSYPVVSTVNYPIVKTQQPITIINNPAPYMPLYYPLPSQTVVNNNYYSGNNQIVEKNKKKDEEEDDDKTRLIVGSVGLGLVSIAGTYVFAKDEYVNYLLSGIDTLVAELTELQSNSPMKMDILQFKDDYRNWRNAYLTRVRKNFIGKGGAISATALGLGAFMVGSGVGLVVGLVGAAASGCYLLWRNLTQRRVSERELYYVMIMQLGKIMYVPIPMLTASAPPLDEPIQYSTLFLKYSNS